MYLNNILIWKTVSWFFLFVFWWINCLVTAPSVTTSSSVWPFGIMRPLGFIYYSILISSYSGMTLEIMFPYPSCFSFVYFSAIFPADLFWRRHIKWWQSIFSLKIKGRSWKDSKLCVTVASWSLCALAAGVIKLVCITEK